MARERFTGTSTPATASGVGLSEVQLASELASSTAVALAADPPAEDEPTEEARSLNQLGVDEPRRSATAVSLIDAEQETQTALLQSAGSAPNVAQARSPRQLVEAPGQETAPGGHGVEDQVERKPKQDEAATVLPPASIDASVDNTHARVSTDDMILGNDGLDLAIVTRNRYLEIVMREDANDLSQPAADDSSRRSSISTVDLEKNAAARLERDLDHTMVNLSARWQDVPSPHGSFRSGSFRGASSSFRAGSFK